MPKCKISRDPVEWFISKRNVESNIVPKLTDENLSKNEYSGIITFYDHNCRLNGPCDKKGEFTKSNKGESASVETPIAYVNYHTHPKGPYLSENVKWGWPSGEDMYVCLEFNSKDNLAHLVFTLEGTYVIKCVSKPLKKIWKPMERVLQETHKFRSGDHSYQYEHQESDDYWMKEFDKELLSPIRLGIKDRNAVGIPPFLFTLHQWVFFINRLTPNHVKKLYKKIKNKNIDIGNPKDKQKNDIPIFEVNFIREGNDIKFKQIWVSDGCPELN